MTEQISSTASLSRVRMGRPF